MLTKIPIQRLYGNLDYVRLDAAFSPTAIEGAAWTLNAGCCDNEIPGGPLKAGMDCGERRVLAGKRLVFTLGQLKRLERLAARFELEELTENGGFSEAFEQVSVLRDELERVLAPLRRS